MQSKLLFLFNFSFLIALLSCSPLQPPAISTSHILSDSLNTFTNPIISKGADPWVIKDNNAYYFCFAGGGPKGTSGISISKSSLLSEPGERVLVWHSQKEDWNSKNLWAPELHKFDSKWYIYYTAGKAGPPYIHQRSGVLESVTSDPQGEYIEKGILQTGIDTNDYVNTIWAIDLTVSKINGKLYAIWSGWDKNEQTDVTDQHLFIAEMSNPYTISSPRVKISTAEKVWEKGGALNILEGPQVLKHKYKILIIYSTRESWTKDYKLGKLTLIDSTRTPLDPENWIKNGPVFQGTDEVFGTGHASFTTSPDDKEWWILFHTKKAKSLGWERDVRLQKFTWDQDGEPVFGKPVPQGVRLMRPSGEINIIRKKNESEQIIQSNKIIIK